MFGDLQMISKGSLLRGPNTFLLSFLFNKRTFSTKKVFEALTNLDPEVWATYAPLFLTYGKWCTYGSYLRPILDLDIVLAEQGHNNLGRTTRGICSSSQSQKRNLDSPYKVHIESLNTCASATPLKGQLALGIRQRWIVHGRLSALQLDMNLPRHQGSLTVSVFWS